MYTIWLQRYRDYKIWICGNSFKWPSCMECQNRVRTAPFKLLSELQWERIGRFSIFQSVAFLQFPVWRNQNINNNQVYVWKPWISHPSWSDKGLKISVVNWKYRVASNFFNSPFKKLVHLLCRAFFLFIYIISLF